MKRIAVTLGALAAAGAIYALVQLQAAGQFRSVEVLHPGTCRTVEGMAGPEDIELHPNQAYALISSYDRRSASEGRPRPGALFRLALTREAEPVNLTPGAGLDFRPHGISMYADPDGRTTLFVVNHPRWRRFGPPSGDATGPRHTIEVYDLTDTGLVHRRTLADPLLVSPNDLVALDHDRFYVTNDHGTEPGLLRRLEDYLRLPWANVLYYDGAAFQRVADGLSYANGIQLSADGERLYVSEVTRSRVREYRREPETGRLAELRRVDVGFGADNINLEPATGALWVPGTSSC